MMKRLWLVFAQTIAVCVVLWLVAINLKQDWFTQIVHQISKPVIATRTVVVQEAASSKDAAPVGSYRSAVHRAMPAVVNIYSSKTVRNAPRPLFDDPLLWKFFGDRFRMQPDLEEKLASLGSGVIVSSQGYILTNNHVVEAADQIEVALFDGRKMPAHVVGDDPETDLAVIKIDLPAQAAALPAITLASAEQYQTGDVVLAIGNPFGVGQTVTMGIISATGRNHLGINTFENFIQTDAAINPGNSGGALIDTQGHLVGINSAIYSRTGGSLGIGFAIPVSIAKIVMESIIKTGSVTRGWIGVEPREMTADALQSLGLQNLGAESSAGVLIAGVLKNGPADQAGVKPGDILKAVDAQPVTEIGDMLSLISQLQPGARATLHLIRATKPLQLTVTVGKRPARASRTEQPLSRDYRE